MKRSREITQREYSESPERKRMKLSASPARRSCELDPKWGCERGDNDRIDVHATILRNLSLMGIERLNVMQRECLENIRNGRDMIVVSDPYAGKMIAYMVALADQMMGGRLCESVDRALVITPCHLMVDRIFDGFNKLLRSIQVGVRECRDSSSIGKTDDILVGTPENLKNWANKNVKDFDSIGCIIIDDFDAIVELSMLEDVKRVLRSVRREVNIAIFTSTMNRELDELAFSLIPKSCSLFSCNDLGNMKNVDQMVVQLQKFRRKRDKLYARIRELEKFISSTGGKTAIFTKDWETARMAKNVVNSFGVTCQIVHEKMTDRERRRKIERFKRISSCIVCTDMFSGALDDQNLEWAVSFDLPDTESAYIRRISRPGRGCKRGKSVTFYGSEDFHARGYIVKTLDMYGSKVPSFFA